MSFPEIIPVKDGETVASPGMFAMSLDWYHDNCAWRPSISSSGLREMWTRSPAHYWLTSPHNPNRAEREPNDAFDFGAAAHFLLLQGRKGFDRSYSVRPDRWSDWRTKDAREWRDAERESGKTVVTLDDLENIAGMAKSLAAHPVVRAGALDGHVERSLIWKDAETGIVCKSRPDAIPSDDGMLCDLKTAASVSDDAIQQAIANYGYFAQAALAAEACQQVLGLPLHSFSLVFCEKAPPWCVRVITLGDEDIQRGRSLNRAMVHRFALCLESGEWPGPGDGEDAEIMGLSTRFRDRLDERLARELPEIETALYMRRANQGA